MSDKKKFENRLKKLQNKYDRVFKNSVPLAISNVSLAQKNKALEKQLAICKEALEIHKELVQKLTQWCEAYPDDIFIPPTTEQWKQAHKYFKEEWGFPLDKISGEYGRRWVKSLKKYLNELTKALAFNKTDGGGDVS